MDKDDKDKIVQLVSSNKEMPFVDPLAEQIHEHQAKLHYEFQASRQRETALLAACQVVGRICVDNEPTIVANYINGIFNIADHMLDYLRDEE